MNQRYSSEDHHHNHHWLETMVIWTTFAYAAIATLLFISLLAYMCYRFDKNTGKW